MKIIKVRPPLNLELENELDILIFNLDLNKYNVYSTSDLGLLESYIGEDGYSIGGRELSLDPQDLPDFEDKEIEEIEPDLFYTYQLPIVANKYTFQVLDICRSKGKLNIKGNISKDLLDLNFYYIGIVQNKEELNYLECNYRVLDIKND